jgi:hypothetical protein
VEESLRTNDDLNDMLNELNEVRVRVYAEGVGGRHAYSHSAVACLFCFLPMSRIHGPAAGSWE